MGLNLLNFQILAYLLTIDLLYGTIDAYHKTLLTNARTRQDSSEMLPDGQKVEKTQQKSRKHMLNSAILASCPFRICDALW